MPPSGWDSSWPRYSESRPIPVEDGVSTTKLRGDMAEQWWSKRFVEMLDTYGLGGRMQRGRRYARTGHLVSFDVASCEIQAQVQGSRSRPYEVTIVAPTASDEQWADIEGVLASRVRFAARLLAGEVPRELEEVFAAAGVPLLPKRWTDIDAYCSCPDSANPCKHIAATLYVFADRLDGDPWLLLEWRGLTREQILGPLLGHVTPPDRDGTISSDETADAQPIAVGGDVSPWWPLDPARKWPVVTDVPRGDSAGVLAEVDPPDPPDTVLRRLRDLETETNGTPVIDRFREVYRVATARDEFGP